jgi:3-phenylpropionate/trans-cinnamate dioxygenase ferredoxin reductase subunit
VRVLAGRCFGGRSSDPEFIHACQSRIVSDLKVVVEEVPEVMSVSGRVADLVSVAPDVFEVCVEPSEPLHFIPGQYCSVQFRGYPARCYSPTAPLDWPCDASLIRFHIRVLVDGRVSSALGWKIGRGHRVKLTGPFGTAYLRPYRSQRLVLVASGTGFAPIWAIAEAAIREMPQRKLVLLVTARTLESFYMIPALCRLALFPNVSIVPIVSSRRAATEAVREGRPTDYLPALSARDVVYAAGAPAMVEAIARIAAAAGAKCHSDPFEPDVSRSEEMGFLSRAAHLFSGETASPPLSMADWHPQNPEDAEPLPGPPILRHVFGRS